MGEVIREFQGENRWLSNFWPSEVLYGGVKYPTVEHFYQAMKTKDVDVRIKIASLASPAEAKRFGKRLELRSDWLDIRDAVMRRGLELKFPSNRKWLGWRLVETNDTELIEGNSWGDTYWGVCNGVGENVLGNMLMRRRWEIKK